ncbi:MAG TPA: dihydrodipicolinate synthase family protein [Syntrophales bacterium]|nr:dihydrodipicolinate synthase family protein [Syntrophales bacterium]
MSTVASKRKNLQELLFPRGIPPLWCPPLTHFDAGRRIDLARMEAHLAWMMPHVKGYLVPGSTGDGWDLDDAETDTVVRFAVEMARTRGVSLLLGALRKKTTDVTVSIERYLGILHKLTGKSDPLAALVAAGVSGFTICPPAGKDLDQATIVAALEIILDMGLPVALYQLPQVTENEAAPETFAKLVAKYPNLILFKDSSGADRIALSGVDARGVFLVRGAEGDYARWLRSAGGAYDGFLLSTANSFPAGLLSVVNGIREGRLAEALRVSTALSGTVGEVFGLVGEIPCGNAFTNANKAIEHFMAFGPAATDREGPMLHGGIRIPAGIITATGDILRRYGLMPEKGYLE